MWKILDATMPKLFYDFGSLKKLDRCNSTLSQENDGMWLISLYLFLPIYAHPPL